MGPEDLPNEQKEAIAAFLHPIGNLKPSGRFKWKLILVWTFIPWAVSGTAVSILSLKFRFGYPLVAMILSLLIIVGALVYPTIQMRRADTMVSRYWALYGLIVIGAAAIWGVYLGQYNYDMYMKHYLELDELKKYHSIDPDETHGAEVWDASLIEFAPKTKIDRHRAGCYKKEHVWCLAPIVSKDGGAHKTPPTGSFDFFAVGRDCCMCPDADFRCGAWSNYYNPSGLRVIDSRDTQFYNLALQQWEAAWGKKANRPLFFYWTNEPNENLNYMQHMGRSIVTLTLIWSFLVYFVLAIITEYFINGKKHWAER